MDRPFMTWQEKDRLLDEKDKEIKRFQDKYEKPGQKCGNGHVNNLPMKLWDCPVCTEYLRNKIKDLKKNLNRYGSHASTCISGYKHSGGIRAKCNCGYDNALKDQP